MFEIVNGTFSRFYNPSKNLAIDKVIFFIQRKGNCQTVCTKQTQAFWHKIFKLFDSTGYTYDVKVYLGKDRQCMAQHLIRSHVTVTELTKKIKGCGHELYVTNFFSSPELFNDLAEKEIYCCGSVMPNRRGMPQDLAPKTIKLKQGDICIRTMADLTEILWRDKRDICTLTNIHDVPAEGNFCIEGGKAIKLQMLMNYHISRTIRRTFFPEKYDLKSTCVLYTEGKYLFPNL